MNVGELKEILKFVDDELELIVQKDSEGNGYSPLAGIDPDVVYVADSTYSGTAYDAEWTADECCLEEDEWNKLKAGPRCAILFPVS